jgi:hypothetical protein
LQRFELLQAKALAANLPLKRSTCPFCIGLPGVWRMSWLLAQAKQGSAGELRPAVEQGWPFAFLAGSWRATPNFL